MKGDFEQAISNNEIIPFLKGEGDYFSPDEWCRGYHCYMINFMGMMGGLEEKEHPYQLLIKYFRLYLSSLEENVEDAWSLFENIECYYHLRKDNSYFFLTQNEDLIDELTAEERKKIGVLYRYLRDNFDKVPDAENMNPLDIQFNFTRKNGCPYDLFSF
ncbi:hypothetical protein DKK70_11315 [Gilliamella apicola]|uniref:Uncharacterized protein n=1 Tax=Gilliamella apicola TaxID=1196095 RepID=A0A2V4E7Z6_9GAMM|nr:hypothetical protein [Gilliamella apicola]PXZ06544.1 hypothetical protein DKK70_11315 [Gilliamella apicola]